MADQLELDTKVSREGRVVIPAAVRALLGVGPGDRVRFVVDDGGVRLVTAQSLLSQIWANNRGGDTGESPADVRATRRLDIAHVEAKWERIDEAHAAEARSERQIEEALLSQLGLDQ